MSDQVTDELFRKTEVWLRFVRVDPSVGQRLRATFPSASLESIQPDVISMRLKETLDIDSLRTFLSKEALSEGSYGVWISLVTSSDHGGMSVPKYVLDVISATGAGLDFSFVACLN